MPQKLVDEFKDLTERKEFSFKKTITISYFWEMWPLDDNDWGIEINETDVDWSSLNVVLPDVAEKFIEEKETHERKCKEFKKSLEKYGPIEKVIEILCELS